MGLKALRPMYKMSPKSQPYILCPVISERELLAPKASTVYKAEDQVSAFEGRMQIRVKCSCGEECPEWAIIELQGMVEVQPQFQNRLQNLKIGVLCRPSLPETYTFTVGYHELTGTKLPLKKPLLVLNKVKGGSGKMELEVIGIIRHRILFKTRPKALISKAQPTVKEKAALASSK